MKSKAPIWMWLNILSLDAPIVALVWQDFLPRCYPSMLRPSGRVVLGLTVWAIYLADRILDVRHPPPTEESIRHRFYREHPKLAASLLAIVLLIDVLVALVWLRPAVFANGLVTLAAVALYLWIFGLWRPEQLVSKKAAAAILFASGVFIVASTGVENLNTTLLGLWLSFGTLCLANLVLIEKWDRGDATDSGWVWMCLLAALCGSFGSRSPWFYAVAAAALALGILDLAPTRRLSRDARRILADAVLLTPLLFR